MLVCKDVSRIEKWIVDFIMDLYVNKNEVVYREREWIVKNVSYWKWFNRGERL